MEIISGGKLRSNSSHHYRVEVLPDGWIRAIRLNKEIPFPAKNLACVLNGHTPSGEMHKQVHRQICVYCRHPLYWIKGKWQTRL